MKVPVVMPQLGLTMTEGSVGAWLKKPGELVGKGEMLFVVSTDKADMEVESLDEGRLAETVVEPGKVVPVGTVIAYLERPEVAPGLTPAGAAGGERTGIPGSLPRQARPLAQAETAGGEEARAESGRSTEPAKKAEGRASPRARRLAKELGVEITQVKASGASGRIVEEDVRRFAESSRPPAAAAAGGDLRRRQLIAERMVESLRTIPHFSVSVEVKADELLALRESLKGAVEREAGQKLTVTDLLLKALGLALAETPEMQAVWEEGTLRRVGAIDLGLAIGAERGVVAPVIRQVETLDLVQIARRRQEVTEKVRQGRLSLRELEGGIGTLSNLGMYRVDHFQALISPGQSFILAVGKIAKRPWVEAGALTVATTVVLNLSVDHRVADGTGAAEFLGKLAGIIEEPYRLLWRPAKTTS